MLPVFMSGKDPNKMIMGLMNILLAKGFISKEDHDEIVRNANK